MLYDPLVSVDGDSIFIGIEHEDPVVVHELPFGNEHVNPEGVLHENVTVVDTESGLYKYAIAVIDIVFPGADEDCDGLRDIKFIVGLITS